MTAHTIDPHPSLRPREVLASWGRILAGRTPLLSIEITRECPLSCPGCYAYGDQQLGGFESTLNMQNAQLGPPGSDGLPSNHDQVSTARSI